ncbi:hypothetical protein KSP40_PGU007169 [Platanthera guangdongensis]|uniref:FAS1 domain-containing protein n=1 Tax=Platanthera guangdongensis TaxID=2320717 RepID=A0ABR2MGK4_9ASPA
MALAANCYRLALLSTILFNRFSSSPSPLPFHTLPSTAPWYAPPPPTSAPSPSSTLRSRGYFLMAGILDYASGNNHAGWNGSGTLFAPSDSAFRNYLRLPPYPTPSTLLYHTARMPSLLSTDIATMPPGSSLPTLSRRRRCVFFRPTAAGQLCIAETPFPRSQPCVKIRDPDLFHDGNLAIHGIDGVLDPSIAYPCGPDTRRSSSPHLDAAVAALRRKGYFAVADAMLVRRSELARLPAVTLFAPSYIDGDADGFREALGSHVIPRRYDLHDLARLSMGQRLQTIASNGEIVVGSDVEGAVTVDGISIDGDAIYRSRWAVILPVRRQIGSSPTPPTPEESPLDSASGPLGNDGPDFAPSNDYLQESSNGGTRKAGDGGQSDNSLTHGLDPAVISPDEWCNANVTPSVRHIAPCHAFDTPPAVGDAATTAGS